MYYSTNNAHDFLKDLNSFASMFSLTPKEATDAKGRIGGANGSSGNVGGDKPQYKYGIKGVYFNNPYTVIKWADGTVTKAKCQNDDIYDKEKGLMVCLLKKLSPGRPNKYYDIISYMMKMFGESGKTSCSCISCQCAREKGGVQC